MAKGTADQTELAQTIPSKAVKCFRRRRKIGFRIGIIQPSREIHPPKVVALKTDLFCWEGIACPPGTVIAEEGAASGAHKTSAKYHRRSAGNVGRCIKG